jgi:hypothetical protein
MENDDKVAEEFNKEFVEKIDNLRRITNPGNIDIPSNNIQSEIFQLKKVKEKRVLKELKSLTNSTSSGNDGIPKIVLKRCADVLTIPLTWTINTSITTGKFPAMYKNAIIDPLYKKDPHEKAENYRLVAKTCEIGKLINGMVE